jgi:hypothetical protein
MEGHLSRMGGGARRDPLQPSSPAAVHGDRSEVSWELPALGPVGYLWLTLPAGGADHQQEATLMTAKWKGLSATCVGLAVLIVVSAALAAGPLKGGSYAGSLIPSRDGVTVSFKVSASGKKVTGLSTSNTPLYCSGGGKPTPVHFKNATISGAGRFSSTGKYLVLEGPKKGQVGANLKITGKFLKGGKEQGTLTTAYVGFSECSGKSTYSTKA